MMKNVDEFYKDVPMGPVGATYPTSTSSGVTLSAIRLRATAKHIRAVSEYRNLLGDADYLDEAANELSELKAKLAEWEKPIADAEELCNGSVEEMTEGIRTMAAQLRAANERLAKLEGKS